MLITWCLTQLPTTLLLPTLLLALAEPDRTASASVVPRVLGDVDAEGGLSSSLLGLSPEMACFPNKGVETDDAGADLSSAIFALSPWA